MHIKHARDAPRHPSGMPKRFLGLPRVAAMAIALVAAALVLLRPVCESWHAGMSSHASTVERMAVSTQVGAAHADRTSVDACCSSDDTGVVSAVRAVSPDRGSDSPSIAPPLGPSAFILLSVAAHAILRRRALPRTPHSYCLRSARILR